MKFWGLETAKAQDFFRNKSTPDYWESLDPDMRDATLITYGNRGSDAIEKNYAALSGQPYKPAPGSGGDFYLANRDRLSDAIAIARQRNDSANPGALGGQFGSNLESGWLFSPELQTSADTGADASAPSGPPGTKIGLLNAPVTTPPNFGVGGADDSWLFSAEPSWRAVPGASAPITAWSRRELGAERDPRYSNFGFDPVGRRVPYMPFFSLWSPEWGAYAP